MKASDLQAPANERQANERKFRLSRTAVEPCFLCGRPLTEQAVENGYLIHLTTADLLVPEDYVGSDSQGCFPVGSECAKRIPADLKFKG